MKFQFDYLISRYLYIYYLPSGLFVVVSWVSFLIPPEVVPGRMALLVTLFLVLINIFNTITNISPNTEGMTAIASWMIACMFFVFGALLAYATILYFLMVSLMCVCWCLNLDKFLAVTLNVKKKSLLKNRSELSFMGKNLRFFLCSWKESSNWQTFPRVATGILIGRACWNCWFEVDFFRLSSMLGGAICNFWEFLGNSFEESVHGKLFFFWKVLLSVIMEDSFSWVS